MGSLYGVDDPWGLKGGNITPRGALEHTRSIVAVQKVYALISIIVVVPGTDTSIGRETEWVGGTWWRTVDGRHAEPKQIRSISL